MSDINELVQRYLAAWSETDAAARQAIREEVSLRTRGTPTRWSRFGAGPGSTTGKEP